jgi:hypothetical protein
LRFRGLGDEAVASSLKQSIEHEALVSAPAADDGIRTARLLGVTEVDADRLIDLGFEAAVAELRPEQIQAALPRLRPDASRPRPGKARKAHGALLMDLAYIGHGRPQRACRPGRASTGWPRSGCRCCRAGWPSRS